MTEINIITSSSFLNLSKNILSFFGIWLSSERNILWKMYMVFIMITQYLFVLFEIVFIVGVWGDIGAVSEASFLLFTQASVCYKTTAFLINEKYLVMLIGLMESEIFEPESKTHERILFVLSRRIKRLCIFFLTSAISTCTLWGLMPLFDAGNRSFPFMIWMPVTPETSPGFELGYVYQMCAIYISALLFVGVDGVALSMIMFGCAQLEIVMDKLKKVQSVPAPSVNKMSNRQDLLQSNQKLLTACIRRHQALAGFIQMVEDTYHANIFFQLMGTVAIVCNIGLRLRITIALNDTGEFFSMLNYLVTMLSQLFLYCWCGHELTIRSEDLHTVLYECIWYEQSVQFKRDVVFAMMRMRRPLVLKAGHYIPLLRQTFVSILRISYSYFAVLNQTM